MTSSSDLQSDWLDKFIALVLPMNKPLAAADIRFSAS